MVAAPLAGRRWGGAVSGGSSACRWRRGRTFS